MLESLLASQSSADHKQIINKKEDSMRDAASSRGFAFLNADDCS